MLIINRYIAIIEGGAILDQLLESADQKKYFYLLWVKFLSFLYVTFISNIYQIKLNQIKSNQIKLNQIKLNQIKYK
jgi:hypothetical protein